MKDQVDKLTKDFAELMFEHEQMSFELQSLKQELQDNKITNNFGIAGQQVDVRDVQSFVKTAVDATEVTKLLASVPQKFHEQIFIDNTQADPPRDRLYIYDTQAKNWRYCEFV